jgi:uncharacterized protein DUF6777
MKRLGAVRWVICLFAVLVFATVGAGCGGSDSKKPAAKPAASNAQTIRFQRPEDPGPSPFTEPADVSGSRTVSLQSSGSGGGSGSDGGTGGSGPYGGSGSDKVCDRDQLIRFLRANPERMRAWAGVLGIDSDYRSVSRYIAKLHPVTLTRDTQVTNHSFVNGRATAFQSILQAGTAVLVDRYGHPVVRCRCGNPLTEPIYIETAKCIDCPPHYQPPTYCKLWTRETDYDYTDDYYSNEEYDDLFIDAWRDGPYVRCYEAYPDPPHVTLFSLYKRAPPEPEPEPQPYNPQPQQSQPYQRQPYDDDQDHDGGTTGGDTTGGGTTGGDTTGGGTTGGDTTGGGTTGGDTTGGGTTG